MPLAGVRQVRAILFPRRDGSRREHKRMKTMKLLSAIAALGLFTFTAIGQTWLTNGLVAYYPLDENANDASGNGHNGTPTAVTYGTNRLGQASKAASFDGISSTIPIFGLSNANYLPVTLSVWLKGLPTQSSDYGIICKYAVSSANGFAMLSFNNFVHSWYFGSQGNVYGGNQGLLGLNTLDGQWHQIISTFDSNGGVFYLDGVAVDSVGWTGNPSTATSPEPVIIGEYRSSDGTDSRKFTGMLDDVRIYQRALSSSEVAQLYAYESSSNSNQIDFLVTSTADSGAGSLRQAILRATTANTNSTINFAVTGTIALGSTLPAITTALTINGPGTNLLTISGNNSVRVLVVNANAKVTISGLTIANGRATSYANGAGIANAGKLTVQNCALVSNTNLSGSGGGIYNSGSLSVISSLFARNQVIGENGAGGLPYYGAGGGGAGMGGAIFNMAGKATFVGCAFVDNVAIGGNGANGNASGTGNGGGINGGYGGGAPGGGNAGLGGGGSGSNSGGFNGADGGFGGGGGAACGGFNTRGGYAGYGAGNGGGTTWSSGNGGGGGGVGIGGGIFLANGSVTIGNCTFSGNQSIGGSGGAAFLSAYNGSNGSGIGPDFFNMSGTILPTLTATTLGGGSVTANPSAPPYLNNSLATVTATPASGWTLLNWLGDASGANSTVNVSVTRNKYVQAIFGTSLTVGGLISAYPQATLYPYGTAVKLTALPPAGLYLAGWSGSASGTNNPLSFAVTGANPSVSALFGGLTAGQSALTVVENGRGHVTVNPYSNIYTTGQTVTLTPLPDAGQSFTGWTGDASGTASPLVVTMNQSKTITANFTKLPSLQVGTTLDGMVDGGFRLTINGEFGAQYQIYNSTNLPAWTLLGTVTNTFGVSQFLDANGTNALLGFYRLMQSL